MYVCGLDSPWLATPFIRHRFAITTPSQLEQLRACGVRFVEIDTDYGQDVLTVEPPGEAIPAGKPDGAATLTSAQDSLSALAQVPSAPASASPAVSFEEELPVAREAYRSAKTIVQQAMHDLRMGREINTEAVAHVVDRLVDSVLRHEGALTSLSRLKSFDEYTFYHSVNTSVLALALGRNLQMDRESLHLLGMGALLHDVGKTKIPLQILNKPDRLTSFEYEIIKQHALRGAEILSNTTGVPELAVLPALEHHERVNGTGYPFGRKQPELSLSGMITAVADIYDAITTDRCYHRAKSPHAALQFLYKLAERGDLHLELVQRFIRCVGIYPVGTCVKLNTGEIGLVTEVHPHDLLRPRLLLLRDREAQPIMPARALDLSIQADEPQRSILSPVDPGPLGIDPHVYLDGEVQAEGAQVHTGTSR
jgi:putative nucleotidyltransferase with HDIG domain